MMSDGSGQTLPGSLLTWDRATSSWRTSPDLFGTASHTSSPTLPTSGSMRNGVVSARPPLVPLTSVDVSGYGQLWPTPTAWDAKAPGPSQVDRDTPGLSTAAVTHGHRGETTPMGGPPTADLNPPFVEALMGLPDGWSDPEGSVSGFTLWVTDWSRKLGRTPSGN